MSALISQTFQTQWVKARGVQFRFRPRVAKDTSAALLAHSDPRFTWDTHWAGDLDLFTYPKGRASFLADYQALLGSEYRPFDPYQSTVGGSPMAPQSISSVGGSQPHTNFQPYLCVDFIISLFGIFPSAT